MLNYCVTDAPFGYAVNVLLISVKQLSVCFALVFVEWGLQQTHSCSIHGASQPWHFGRCPGVTEDSAVGQLSNASVQEVQQQPDSED